MFRVSHQRADHNSHFDSGTATTIFLPPNEEFLRQAAEGAKTSITPHEIQELHADAAPRIVTQNVHTVLKMLINAPGFGFDTYNQRNSEVFNRPPVSETLPTGPEYALEQFMMNTCTINESTAE